MEGYLRPDGRKGIRNVIAVAYLVECARHVAHEIATAFHGQDVHVIGFPGCYPMAVQRCRAGCEVGTFWWSHPREYRRLATCRKPARLIPLDSVDKWLN
jgi:altronate dehydratase